MATEFLILTVYSPPRRSTALNADSGIFTPRL